MVRVVDYGVVFDLDGVLVNTEELGWEVWRSLAGGYGLELTLEDLRAITGCTDDESVQYFRKWLGEPELAVLGEHFQTGFAAAKRERTQAYPDALETLTALQDRSAPVAVASNSTTSDVEAALKRAGLAGLVQHVVGVDQVERPKPAPDIYELATSMLECGVAVAVEDSPTGIASARAAGLPVLAVDRGLFDVASLADATTTASAITYASLESLASHQPDSGPN